MFEYSSDSNQHISAAKHCGPQRFLWCKPRWQDVKMQICRFLKGEVRTKFHVLQGPCGGGLANWCEFNIYAVLRGTRRLNRYLRQSKVRSAPRHFYTSTAFAPTECPGRVLSGFANQWSQCGNHNQVYQPSQINAKLLWLGISNYLASSTVDTTGMVTYLEYVWCFLEDQL